LADVISLRPGRMALADWRAIYRDAPVEIDPLYRADVEAGAAALRSILEKNGGCAETAAPGQDPEPCPDRTTSSTTNEPLPTAVSRLIVALKTAALARGALGVRWNSVEALAGRLSNGAAPPQTAGAPKPGHEQARPDPAASPAHG
jgi:histidine ammonia-lyase